MKAKKRLLSLLLCGTMLFSLCPQSVLAETIAQDSGAAISAGGLCKHHSEHDEDCGYTEGTAGSPCTYEHTDDCYREVINCIHKHDQDCYLQDSVSEDDATPSNAEKREPENCPHICDEDSGCVTKNWTAGMSAMTVAAMLPPQKGRPANMCARFVIHRIAAPLLDKVPRSRGRKLSRTGMSVSAQSPAGRIM